MSAFAPAVDAIFADPVIGIDAMYLGGGIPPGIPVRVIRKVPDGVADYGTARIVQPAVAFDVRISEVPAAAKGDRIRIGDEFWEVQAAPLRDSEGLVWKLDVRPV